MTLTHEITALADANREFVSSAYHAARETMLVFGGNRDDGYTATGQRAGIVRQRRILDEVI
jgi:hypothetical protein